MTIIGTFKTIIFNKRKSKVKKKFDQLMVSFVTFALLVSPGLGVEDEKPPSCKGEDFGFCTSPCTYVRNKCNGDKECSMEVCSYLYPICYPQLSCPRFFQLCWDSVFGCAENYEDKNTIKRSILNKNFAYLLLKLHPFLNQTSQFGFLSSGRIRRITGNFGTEFLGKRSNNKPNNSRTSSSTSSAEDPNKQKTKPKFYSLPLNKFSQTKILKRTGDFFYGDPQEKRLSIRGNGRVIVGSEFLGKRTGIRNFNDDKIRRSMGNEFLGKRNFETFDGSEFLGKRAGNFPPEGTEFLGKRNNDLLSGTELLGKKSNKETLPEYLRKRYGNELLGKRYLGNEFLGKRDRGVQNEGIWTEDDPELIDEALYNYRTFQSQKENSNVGPTVCAKGICEEQKSKDAAVEQHQVTDSD